MKKIGLLSFLVFILILINACEKDYLVPKVVTITTPVSFSTDVVPILTEDCAVPTCHITGGITPDLSADHAYDQLTGLGYVDTSNAESSILYVRIIATTNPMPPSGSLTGEEIGYILAWIEQGAQNN